MGHSAPTDHLDLWRGIDDAIWREALRPPARPPSPNLTPTPHSAAPHPARPRIPEPA